MSQDGFVVVDKPAGWTSHDVVGKVRRLARTRRVGHAGTLDPMATGVLVLGVHRATRLLGYAAGTSKAYAATIRLGQSTNTDDAMGEVSGGASAEEVTEERIRAAVQPLTGDIEQVPSSVSAIKVDGKRAYKRAREGESVELAARPIRVDAFDVLEVAPPAEQAEAGERGLLDVRVTVECSSGTYVRALARDLGAALGVGGHLTALRRTRVGPWTLEAAHTLEALACDFTVIPIERVVEQTFPRVDVDADTARLVGFGQRLTKLPAVAGEEAAELVGIFDPDGRFLALYQAEGTDGPYRPVAVFTG